MIDQYADRAADRRGEFGHGAGEFVRDETVRLEPPATKPFEGLGLTRLETLGVAVDLDRDGLAPGARQRRRKAVEGGGKSARDALIARVGEAMAGGQATEPNRRIGGLNAPEGPGIPPVECSIVGSRQRRPPRRFAILSLELRSTCRVPAAESRLQAESTADRSGRGESPLLFGSAGPHTETAGR